MQYSSRKSFGWLLDRQTGPIPGPPIWTDSFFSALQEAFPPMNIEAAHGVELDPLFANAAMELRTKQGLRIAEGAVKVHWHQRRSRAAHITNVRFQK